MHTKFSFLLIILAGLFTSCTKNEPVKPVEPPKPTRSTGTLHFEGLSSDTASNEISIKLNADSTDKVEVIVDQVVVSTIDKAPFDIRLNTLDYEDGPHDVKLNVVGKDQNITELSKTISVQNTLVTIREPIGPREFYYLITDEEGNILNEVHHRSDVDVVKIKPKKPFNKEFFNLFLVEKFSGWGTTVSGYIHLKKGISWDRNPPLYPKVYKWLEQTDFTIKPFSHKFSTTLYDGRVLISTDEDFRQYESTYALQQSPPKLYRADNSKVFMQLESGGQVSYNFFDLPDSTRSMELDPDLLTKAAVWKEIEVPETGGSLVVEGVPDRESSDRYMLFLKYLAGTTNYYRPQEKFDYYITRFITPSDKNGQYYMNYYAGEVPKKVELFNGKIELVNRSLKNFEARLPQKFSYTWLVFSNRATKDPNNVEIALTNTCDTFKLPDFSKLPYLEHYNTESMRAEHIMVTEEEGFDKTRLPYSGPLKYGPYGPSTGRMVDLPLDIVDLKNNQFSPEAKLRISSSKLAMPNPFLR